MSIESLLVTLPEAVEEIVHRYHHQMKLKSVMDELKSKVIFCECCDSFKVNLNKYCCESCNHDMCSVCYTRELSYVEHCGDDEDLVLCSPCAEIEEYMREQVEETESEIAYAEEELWRDMHGIPSISSMY